MKVYVVRFSEIDSDKIAELSKFGKVLNVASNLKVAVVETDDKTGIEGLKFVESVEDHPTPSIAPTEEEKLETKEVGQDQPMSEKEKEEGTKDVPKEERKPKK
jgi:hypothetical protein